ncbi:MAG TPA: GNAT family N-acetyltransferase [Polyangiales bacterium]|nr:GNAT family N-acetyltransferase [Polyangiales bacterium]
MRVRRIAEIDWELARALRLRALQESPDAFAATYAEEHGMADALWQARARSNAAGIDTAGFLAVEGEREVGLAVGVRKASAVELNAMWVAPEARRHGAARALIEAVAAWAVEIGATELSLEVTHTSHAAQALYRGFGFVESGEGCCGARRASALKMRRGI